MAAAKKRSVGYKSPKLVLKRGKRPVYVKKVGQMYMILPPELKDVPGAERINPCPTKANPARTGNFTLKTLVKKVPKDRAADRFAALQRSGQYSELRLIQVGKSFYNIVGYKWPDKGVRRKLGIGRARINPNPPKIKFRRYTSTGLGQVLEGYIINSGPGWIDVDYVTKGGRSASRRFQLTDISIIYRTDENPTAAGDATPNQVTFGSRGRTIVGWINAKTPTQYQITYKDGAQTKTVWRDKSMVRFVKSGKRGRAGEKAANPSPVERASKLSKKFHGAAPRTVKHIDFRSPKCLALIGSCAQLDYISDKWDGKRRQYYHKFEKPCLVMADPDPQPDGSRLIVILGKFKITERGIIG